MKNLTAAEKTFLESRQQEQRELSNSINEIEKQLEPIELEYSQISDEIAPKLAKMRALGKEKKGIIEKSNLSDLKKELSSVVKDTTKLLKKARGA